MASIFSCSNLLALPLLLLLLLSPSATGSQDPSVSSPTIASCQPQLLSLVPCAPFVQGVAQSPPKSCCDNLDQIYDQQPHCLCLLLNTTDLVSLPINSTLALQLPRLCKISADPSLCGSSLVMPGSQVSLGANSSNSVAASPAVLAAPTPSGLRMVDRSSWGVKSGIGFELEIAAGAVAMMVLLS